MANVIKVSNATHGDISFNVTPAFPEPKLGDVQKVVTARYVTIPALTVGVEISEEDFARIKITPQWQALIANKSLMVNKEPGMGDVQLATTAPKPPADLVGADFNGFKKGQDLTTSVRGLTEGTGKLKEFKPVAV